MAPIPKVIRSVSDSFLERFAPNVNDLLSGSAPFLEQNLVITLLDSRVKFAFARQKQISIRYGVNSSTPNRSGPVRFPPCTLHIVSDRFPNRTENRSGIA